MKRKTLEIYALIVCFASIITLIISLGIGIYSVVKIVKPGLTINAYTFKTHQNNESYREMKLHDSAGKKYGNLSEDAVTKMRLNSWNTEISVEKREGFQAFIQSTIFVLIAVIVFLLHWRMAKREKETQ